MAVTEAGRKVAFNFGCQSERENESQQGRREAALDQLAGRVLAEELAQSLIHRHRNKHIRYAFPFL